MRSHAVRCSAVVGRDRARTRSPVWWVAGVPSTALHGKSLPKRRCLRATGWRGGKFVPNPEGAPCKGLLRMLLL